MLLGRAPIKHGGQKGDRELRENWDPRQSSPFLTRAASVPPEIPKPIWRKLGITDGVLDVFVAEATEKRNRPREVEFAPQCRVMASPRLSNTFSMKYVRAPEPIAILLVPLEAEFTGGADSLWRANALSAVQGELIENQCIARIEDWCVGATDPRDESILSIPMLASQHRD
jgi:hypothetical protein